MSTCKLIQRLRLRDNGCADGCPSGCNCNCFCGQGGCCAAIGCCLVINKQCELAEKGLTRVVAGVSVVYAISKIINYK